MLERVHHLLVVLDNARRPHAAAVLSVKTLQVAPPALHARPVPREPELQVAQELVIRHRAGVPFIADFECALHGMRRVLLHDERNLRLELKVVVLERLHVRERLAQDDDGVLDPLINVGACGTQEATDGAEAALEGARDKGAQSNRRTAARS